MLRTLVETQSYDEVPIPSAPAKAIHRTYPGVPQWDDSIELQRLPLSRQEDEPSGPPTPGAERGDLEMSRPASPVPESEGVEALQSLRDPPKNIYRLAAVCVMNFLCGLNDSAPGALIPYMEKHYNIGYAVVSLIFVGNALGFIVAASLMDTLRVRLGRGRLFALSQGLLSLAYIPILCAVPFPVIVFSFLMIGFTFSVNIAIGNTFCGSLRNGPTCLGAMHGCYGIGGTIGPLIATAIVTVAKDIWSRYYFLTLGVALFTVGFASWAFWDYEKEVGPAMAGTVDIDEGNSQFLGMFSALKIRLVLLGALFIFAYQGAEVSISGWVISFLITARDGDPSSVGYVTSGFWGGITIGRFLLSGPAHKIGEKRFVYYVTLGAAAFQLLVWLVPDIIGNAVSVAIVGLLLGPVYPCAVTVFMRGMNRKDRVSSMSIISAFGSSGGAVAPFTTGILAQAVGPWALHPIAISLFGVMLISWFTLPNTRKRTE